MNVWHAAKSLQLSVYISIYLSIYSSIYPSGQLNASHLMLSALDTFREKCICLLAVYLSLAPGQAIFLGVPCMRGMQGYFSTKRFS